MTGALFTRADWDLLPEGYPAELIRGFLVKEPEPDYRHQRLDTRILMALTRLVGADRALPHPVGVPIDEHNHYLPDVAVFDEPPPDGRHGCIVPPVVFEILSPSTKRTDRLRKTPRYLAAGVREVWLVDPFESTIEVHLTGEVRTARGAEEARSDALPGFALVPDVLFAPPRRV